MNKKTKSNFLFILFIVVIFFIPIFIRKINSHDFGNEVLNSTNQENTINESQNVNNIENVIDLNSIPEYAGQLYVAINNNVPYFEESELTTKSYESYGQLDSLGRCTSAIACVGKDLMPTQKRESISKVKPTRMA